MIRVFDNFLDDDHYDALGNTPMTFSEVQWVGRRAKPDNVFHEFIHKIFRAAFPDGASSISGATA